MNVKDQKAVKPTSENAFRETALKKRPHPRFSLRHPRRVRVGGVYPVKSVLEGSSVSGMQRSVKWNLDAEGIEECGPNVCQMWAKSRTNGVGRVRYDRHDCICDTGMDAGKAGLFYSKLTKKFKPNAESKKKKGVSQSVGKEKTVDICALLCA